MFLKCSFQLTGCLSLNPDITWPKENTDVCIADHVALLGWKDNTVEHMVCREESS